MQYVGGKYRIARHIERVVLAARRGEQRYVEPFLGGAATFSRNCAHFRQSLGYDLSLDLVLMWRAVLEGWVPPADVSEAEYAALRQADSSPLRGFVGYGCSFGGKWYGGYARSHGGAAPGYNYAAGAARTVVRQGAAMRDAGAVVLRADYRSLSFGAGDLVYCDPPYSGATGYVGMPEFDSREFWALAGRWAAAGAVVLVSEHIAPAPWVVVWERDMPLYLRGDAQQAGQRRERLFALPDVAQRVGRLEDER